MKLFKYTVFFSALCGAGHCGVRDWEPHLALGKSCAVVSLPARRGLRLSRHADVAHFADEAERHHRAGLCVFGGGDLDRECAGAVDWHSAAHLASGRVADDVMVAGRDGACAALAGESFLDTDFTD